MYKNFLSWAFIAACGLWAGAGQSEVLYSEYAHLTRIEPKEVCFTARNAGSPGANPPPDATVVQLPQTDICFVRAQILVGSDAQHPGRSIEASKRISYPYGAAQLSCVDAHWQLEEGEVAVDMSGLGFRCMPAGEYEVYAAKSRPSSIRSREAIHYLKNAAISRQLGWPQLRPY